MGSLFHAKGRIKSVCNMSGRGQWARGGLLLCAQQSALGKGFQERSNTLSGFLVKVIQLSPLHYNLNVPQWVSNAL